MNKLIPIACLTVASFFIAHAAIADVAPPDNYVEDCTLEKQHFDGMSCITCQGGGAVQPEDEGACDESANEADGYEFVCRTRGASYNTEIWCKDSPGETGPAGDPSSDGCAVVSPGAGGGSWFIVYLLSIVVIRFFYRRLLHATIT